MAIFVSNPTSAAITTLSPDALDPSVMSPEEGFTEELAAAMQPSAAPIDALAKTPLDLPEESVKKASDLQILPLRVRPVLLIHRLKIRYLALCLPMQPKPQSKITLPLI